MKQNRTPRFFWAVSVLFVVVGGLFCLEAPNLAIPVFNFDITARANPDTIRFIRVYGASVLAVGVALAAVGIRLQRQMVK